MVNKDLTLEQLEGYIKDIFYSKETSRKLRVQTGRSGAIETVRLLLHDPTSLDESGFRAGAYTFGDEIIYDGYSTDQPDGTYLVPEYGRFYIDVVEKGWATQLKEISEQEFNDLKCQ
jgi:hypothetical protein